LNETTLLNRGSIGSSLSDDNWLEFLAAKEIRLIGTVDDILDESM
jgi:hypothetical protein